MTNGGIVRIWSMLGAVAVACWFLISAEDRQPYSFYTELRWWVTAGSILVALSIALKPRVRVLWPIWAVVGVVFNPFFPFHLKRAQWTPIDRSTIAVLVGGVLIYFFGNRLLQDRSQAALNGEAPSRIEVLTQWFRDYSACLGCLGVMTLPFLADWLYSLSPAARHAAKTEAIAESRQAAKDAADKALEDSRYDAAATSIRVRFTQEQAKEMYYQLRMDYDSVGPYPDEVSEDTEDDWQSYEDDKAKIEARFAKRLSMSIYEVQALSDAGIQMGWAFEPDPDPEQAKVADGNKLTDREKRALVADTIELNCLTPLDLTNLHAYDEKRPFAK